MFDQNFDRRESSKSLSAYDTTNVMELKAPKLKVSYSRKELSEAIEKKEFIDLYKDFSLQYLKECVSLGRENSKEMKKSIRLYHKESEQQAFQSLRK